MSASSSSKEFQSLVQDYAQDLLKIRECVILVLKLNERLPQVTSEAIAKDLPVLSKSLVDWRDPLCLEDPERFQNLVKKLDEILGENLNDVQDPNPDHIVSQFVSRFPIPLWKEITTPGQDGTFDRECIQDLFLDCVWDHVNRLSLDSVRSGERAVQRLRDDAVSRFHGRLPQKHSNATFSRISFAYENSDLFDDLVSFTIDAMKRYVCMSLLLRTNSLFE